MCSVCTFIMWSSMIFMVLIWKHETYQLFFFVLLFLIKSIIAQNIIRCSPLMSVSLYFFSKWNLLDETSIAHHFLTELAKVLHLLFIKHIINYIKATLNPAKDFYESLWSIQNYSVSHRDVSITVLVSASELITPRFPLQKMETNGHFKIIISLAYFRC